MNGLACTPLCITKPGHLKRHGKPKFLKEVSKSIDPKCPFIWNANLAASSICKLACLACFFSIHEYCYNFSFFEKMQFAVIAFLNLSQKYFKK